MNNVTTKKGLSEFWSNFLREEFKNETDRGAVVLTASLLENALTDLLKKYLTPNSNSSDELFDGPNAILHSFSSKIQMSKRIGLISSRLAKDLNTIKQMRNKFAHNVHGSSLDNGEIKSLLTNLVNSSDIVKGYDGSFIIDIPGERGTFLKVAHIILFHIYHLTEKSGPKPIKPLEDEWLYSWSYKPLQDSELSDLAKNQNVRLSPADNGEFKK